MSSGSFGNDGRRLPTRRDFLRIGGLALAGAAVAPQALGVQPAQAEASGGKKIRIGVVGGNFGCSFQWHEHPHCIVAAVSDLRADRRKRLVNTYKCSKTYDSLEELVTDKSIDAVAVFTGANDHVKHVAECMKYGKHVISAVPACASLEEAQQLHDLVKKIGLTYMMAETSYYRQHTITARQWYEQGKFGEIFYAEAQYFHPIMDKSSLWFDASGKTTWRYGRPPMCYPTHSVAFLLGVTKGRLTHVSCLGFDDGTKPYKDNDYKNPYGCEVALFETEKGHPFRVAEFRRGAVRGGERADWYGQKMSFSMPHPNGLGCVQVKPADKATMDDGGFEQRESVATPFENPDYWKTEMLPEPLRHASGHGGSHTFITHEFIDALVKGRKPAVDLYESLAYTVPGLVAHESALKKGERLKIPNFDV